VGSHVFDLYKGTYKLEVLRKVRLARRKTNVRVMGSNGGSLTLYEPSALLSTSFCQPPILSRSTTAMMPLNTPQKLWSLSLLIHGRWTWQYNPGLVAFSTSLGKGTLVTSQTIQRPMPLMIKGCPKDTAS